MLPCFFRPYHASQWLAAMMAHATVRMPSSGVVSTRSGLATFGGLGLTASRESWSADGVSAPR